MKLDFRSTDERIPLVRLVPCDCCGVHKVPVSRDFDGCDFVKCDVCTREAAPALRGAA
jgi:hypothetical protein